MSLMEEARRIEVGKDSLAIFWLGQNSYIMKTSEGTLIALDLYLSRERPLEVYVHPEPPIRPEEVQVHYVFCTHDHIDHTDPETLRLIAEHSPGTIFLGPAESCSTILKKGVDRGRLVELREGQPLDLQAFKVTAFYSIHPSERPTVHYGYLFDFHGFKLYNMGDSSPKALENGSKGVLAPIIEASPEIAMLPVIGDHPIRQPEDAVKIAELIRPQVVIPSHYDCFKQRTIDPLVFKALFREIPWVTPIIIGYKGGYVYKRDAYGTRSRQGRTFG